MVDEEWTAATRIREIRKKSLFTTALIVCLLKIGRENYDKFIVIMWSKWNRSKHIPCNLIKWFQKLK